MPRFVEYSRYDLNVCFSSYKRAFTVFFCFFLFFVRRSFMQVFFYFLPRHYGRLIDFSSFFSNREIRYSYFHTFWTKYKFFDEIVFPNTPRVSFHPTRTPPYFLSHCSENTKVKGVEKIVFQRRNEKRKKLRHALVCIIKILCLFPIRVGYFKVFASLRNSGPIKIHVLWIKVSKNVYFQEKVHRTK